MGDEQDGLAATLELGELVEALVGEALVADGEHLVDQQDVGIDVDRHRKAEAHVHARRVGLHRRVDELLHLGELDDLVEAARDLALRETEHDAVDEDVLAARRSPGGTRRRARSAPRSGRRPSPCRCVGLVMPATSFSSVLLPDPFRPMTPSVRPRGTVNETSSSAVNVSLGLQIAQEAAREQRALQRRELLAVAVAAVDLR